MQQELLYLYKSAKKDNKLKIKKTIPSIKREDIMSGILSNELNKEQRSILANLYGEIVYMEKRDMVYISEIIVSCQSDLDIYIMLKEHNRKQKNKLAKKIRSNTNTHVVI